MKSYAKGLFIILLAEIAIGGGGRLISFGPVSLRMVLFAAALIFTLIALFSGEKISKEYKILLAFFFVTIVVGWVRGVFNGAQQQYWWEDIKPLLYFLILPFFAIAFKKIENNGLYASSIIRFSAVFLAVAFFIILILIHTGVIPFLDFYARTVNTGEFFFRGEITFFYKGFLYLCIGLIFIHFLNTKHRIALTSLVLLAISLTFTRGFLLALCLTYAGYYLLNYRYIKAAVFTMLAILTITYGQATIGYISQTIDILRNPKNTVSTSASNPESKVQNIPQKNLLGNRDYSDTGRLQQIKEVGERVTPVSFFLGQGFGKGVPSRPIHMEISYIEIFHKQGLLGLAFWSYIFFLLFKKFRYAPASDRRDAFFCGALFVFCQSLTNQYINNPIGLSMVLLTLTYFDQLSDRQISNKK